MDDVHKEGNEPLFDEFQRPSREEWKEAAIALLKGRPFEKAMYTKTPEGITIDPIYDLASLDALSHTGSLPGYAPFVRGTKVSGNLIKPWDICQQVYAGDPEEFNTILIEDLHNGQNALNMPLDAPSLAGIDADNADTSSVGNRGVSISTVADLEVAFKEIIFDALPVHINTGNNPVPLTAMFLALLEKRGTDPASLHGVLGYDPLGQIAGHGTIGITIEKSMNLMSEVLTAVSESDSDLRTILVEGHPYHNGGADSVTELAYMIATGTFYLREMLNRGHSVEAVSKRVVFSLSLGSNFFMEISKIRAARMLWHRIVKEFGGNDDARKMYIHGKTSSWTKTVYDPYVGMLRNTSEAFSGAMGGVDSLTVIPFDEAIREADSFSRRVSRNVQSILQEECHFTRPIDPAGGSWFIESLTSEVSASAWKAFQEIEAAGGMNSIILDGTAAEKVAAKYEEQFRDMAKRKRVWVGVNKYANMSEEKLEVHERNEKELLQKRKKTLAAVRSKRKDFELSGFERGLKGLTRAAAEGATIQELYALSSGDSRNAPAVEPVKKQRGAERFEALRDKTIEMKSSNIVPAVLLLNIGPVPNHKPRADFTRGYFEVGAFDVLSNKGFSSPEEMIEAAASTPAQVAVFCGKDTDYPEIVAQTAGVIKEKRPEIKLVIAGRPAKDLEPVYREAGIDHFIYMGSNCYELLNTLQEGIENNG
ncbi:methylmalonyl-CoA mutase [Candidatus Fermentibacteria bacterium]|nr:MAG: methylmalonyl-CoA mutase [Candidatus Fermentibacteria bacterium]